MKLKFLENPENYAAASVLIEIKCHPTMKKTVQTIQLVLPFLEVLCSSKEDQGIIDSTADA
jgi:hypothetical protein